MKLIFTLLCYLFLTNTAFAMQEKWTVKEVVDGDTIIALKDGNTESFDLRCVDAPESGQEHAAEATEFLKSIVKEGEFIFISKKGKDIYGNRTAEILTQKGKNISYAITDHGYAWCSLNSRCQASPLSNIEKKAKKLNKGLWSSANRVRPSKYRKLNNIPDHYRSKTALIFRTTPYINTESLPASVELIGIGGGFDWLLHRDTIKYKTLGHEVIWYFQLDSVNSQLSYNHFAIKINCPYGSINTRKLPKQIERTLVNNFCNSK